MTTPRDTKTGREELSEWEQAQPDNFFASDAHLQSLLEFYWGKERLAVATSRLTRFGAEAATIVDLAVRRANLHENLPRLDRFSPIGERTESIIHSRDHDIAGELIYGSGAMSVYAEPGNNLLALTLFYISSYNGEAGHNCPLACTAGVIKTLQQVGSESLRRKYLPRLLDANYNTRYHGAQFLTEVQGGSDVGVNSCRATELDPSTGTWLLNGEKWFCSNASADLALVTARPAEGQSGTKGLGLFLVPRLLDDGRPNGLYLRRLKDKLGTRSLATAEIDFRDAICFEIDARGRGFQHVMDFVVNTSRLYNALGSAGAARRALIVAWTYARHRRAFGTSIAGFPLIAEALSEIRCETMALLSGSLYLAQVRDLIETSDGGAELRSFFRFAVNLNKYRASLSGTNVIRRAMEILGGNGAMENFSVLPRLLRDSLIFEAWEGAHNTLLVQCLRDIRRLGVHEVFCAKVSSMFASLRDATWRETGLRECETVRAEVEELRSENEQDGSVFFRPLADRMMYLLYAACLASEAEWEESDQKSGSTRAVVDFLWQRHLNGSRKDYLRQITSVSSEM